MRVKAWMGLRQRLESAAKEPCLLQALVNRRLLWRLSVVHLVAGNLPRQSIDPKPELTDQLARAVQDHQQTSPVAPTRTPSTPW